MKYQYKTIDTRSLEGIRQAEKLQREGWKIINSGTYSIQFERECKEFTIRPDYFFEMSLVGELRGIVTDIVNIGIDSRLEAFTKSEFKANNERLYCWIHHDEIQIMVRRLLETGNNEAESLADDIVTVHFGVKTY